MSLSTILNPPSLAGRLTVWYTVTSTFLFLIVIGIIYIFTSTVLLNQADEDLEEDFEDYEVILGEVGLQAFWQQLVQEVVLDGSDQVLFRLFDSAGNLLYNTDDGYWEEYVPPSDLATQISLADEPLFATVALDHHEYPSRTIYGALGANSENYYLQITESLEQRADVLEIFRATSLISVPIIALLSLVSGLLMARKSLSGVQTVTNTAIDISNGALSERVPLGDQGTEINRLANTFNHMLDKIQMLIRGMRELNDNIAHDLKSPLARIRGIAETTLTENKNKEQYLQLAASTIEECDRLLHLINTMLDLAETEAGLAKTMKQLDLAVLIRDACDLYQPLAAEKAIELWDNVDQSIVIRGNKQFIQRMIGNLLDNAVKYTPENGAVTISSEIQSDSVLIKVEDTGVGISEQDIGSIFQRFYRCDQSRSKSGTGLGLALVQAIAKAHRATISVNSTVAEGSQFVIRFPLLNSGKAS